MSKKIEYIKRCKQCIKPFATKRQNQKFCSYKCYTDYQVQHNRLWTEGSQGAAEKYEARRKQKK